MWFCTDDHGAKRVNPTDIGDPLIIHLVPLVGQSFPCLVETLSVFGGRILRDFLVRILWLFIWIRSHLVAHRHCKPLLIHVTCSMYSSVSHTYTLHVGQSIFGELFFCFFVELLQNEQASSTCGVPAVMTTEWERKKIIKARCVFRGTLSKVPWTKKARICLSAAVTEKTEIAFLSIVILSC